MRVIFIGGLCLGFGVGEIFSNWNLFNFLCINLREAVKESKQMAIQTFSLISSVEDANSQNLK